MAVATDTRSRSSSETVLRVLLVDDDPLVRQALRTALGRHEAFQVTGEAADGAQALAAVAEEHPDIVLMDIDMPEVDGVTATLRIMREAPETHVVMLATEDDPDFGLLGLRAGAAGFLPKDTDTAALIRALTGVAHGEAAISRAMTLHLIRRLRRLPEHAGGLRPVQSNLTSREWEVLDLMMAEASTERIAEELVLSIETVRSHIKHILGKLGAHSRAEAVERAMDIRYADAASLPATEAGELTEAAFRRVFDRLKHRAQEQG